MNHASSDSNEAQEDDFVIYGTVPRGLFHLRLRDALAGRNSAPAGVLRLLMGTALLVSLPSCGGGGGPIEGLEGFVILPPSIDAEDCKPSQMEVFAANHPDMLVDPDASLLVRKILIGETADLFLGSKVGEACNLAFLDTSTAVVVEWVSTDPSVATVTPLNEDGGGQFADLQGIAPGTTSVFATINGSVVNPTYYCCNTCQSPEPPPRCMELPIDHVEVVEAE